MPPQPSIQDTITDSVSAKTFAVVRNQIPAELLEGLSRDFTPSEIESIYARVNKTLAPTAGSGQPQALWVFGPSGVGKSYLGQAKASELFGCAQNAVVIDGGEFRDLHSGWNAVAMHGQEHGLLHADAWPTFKDAGRVATAEAGGAKANGWSGQLKRRILKEALRDRQHVLIPDCANHPDRLHTMLEEVRQAGYGMHAICLYAPLSVTRRRGEDRAVREGKIWSAKKYQKCTSGSLALAMRWIDGLRDEPSVYCSLELWDNTHFPANEVGLEEYATLVAMSHEESEQHASQVVNAHKAEHELASAANEGVLGNLRRKHHLPPWVGAGPPCGFAAASS
jgi:hypothetical protein